MVGCVLSQLKPYEFYILSLANNVELLGRYPIHKMLYYLAGTNCDWNLTGSERRKYSGFTLSSVPYVLEFSLMHGGELLLQRKYTYNILLYHIEEKVLKSCKKIKKSTFKM